MKSSLDARRLSVIRSRLIRMHFESGVGHIGGNLSSIDALVTSAGNPDMVFRTSDLGFMALA